VRTGAHGYRAGAVGLAPLLRLSIIWNVIRGINWILVGLAVAALTAGCGGGGDGSGGKPRVVATTSPIGALVREVAGDRVALTVLIGPGVSAHDFEPSPKNVRSLDGAAVVFANGIGLDAFLDKVLSGAAKSRVVTVTEGVKLLKGGEKSGDDDPHVWHDTENDKIIVANIAKALSAADAANAAVYQQNAAAYQAKLDETDRQVRALIDTIPAANRKMVTNHDAFGYFMARYRLEFVGAIIPGLSSDAQPSAADIAKLEDTIRRAGVKAIFAEDEVDPKVAREISKDTGVKVVADLYADSLGKPGSGAETVHGMLLSNAKKIADALK